MRRSVPAALLAAVVLSLAASAAAAQPPATVHPGDVVRITVWRDADMSGEFEVAPDSTLRHPVYNRLKVGGTPAGTLQTRVLEFLRQFQNDPQVEVQPLFRVTVGGEVRSPRSYLMPATATAGDALTEAGGVATEGNLRRVTVERDGQRRTLDLTRSGAEGADYPIRSGDRITVARQRNILRDVVGPMASVLATVSSLLVLARQ